jgi:hypothetical protein
MLGVSLLAVKELLGHESIEMTLRYAHLSPEVKREAVRRPDSRGYGERRGSGRPPNKKPPDGSGG